MIRQLAPIAAAVLAVGVTAAPAAADGEIGLSQDGTTWTRELDLPLFDDDGFVWVPGDVEQDSVLVRNDGPSAGEIAVEVVAEDPDGLLASEAFLLEARVGTGDWVEIGAGTTALAPAVLDIAQGARTEVAVRGTFRPETTDHEDELAPFRLHITLSEDGDVGGEDDSAGGAGGGGDLPATGSAFGWTTICLAAGLIGAGIALVRPDRSRRREVTRGQA